VKRRRAYISKRDSEPTALAAPDQLGPRPGLTIVEVLVALAILLVASFMVFTALSHGRNAARMAAHRATWYHWARGWLEQVGNMPLSELPPERHVIPPVRTSIQLRHAPVVPGSVTVLTEDGRPLRGEPEIEYADGTLTFSEQDARRAVVLAYAYRVEPAKRGGLEDVWLEIYGEHVDEDMAEAVSRDTGLRRLRVRLGCRHHSTHYGEHFELLRTQ